MSTKVILDVDTGSDDAVAIMAAALSPDIELLACCTVWGNLPVVNTTENTLRLLEKLGKNVPVYKGVNTAMVKYLAQNRIPEPVYKPVYNSVGREIKPHHDFLEELPPATRKCENMDAPSFYVDFLRKAKEPVTLVPVGPMTNLGFALTIDPTIVKNIEQIVIMGGGDLIANRSMCGESNIWHDPEAAHKVLNCGVKKITMVPLDATHAAYTNLEDCKKLRAIGTFAAKYAATLAEQRIEAEAVLSPDTDRTAVHDVLALCSVIEPAVLKDVEYCRCDVGLSDFGEGATFIDHRAKTSENANVYFAHSADREKLFSMLCKIFSRGEK
jgi:inosine-uridine nucleoside N-ribohydrolase